MRDAPAMNPATLSAMFAGLYPLRVAAAELRGEGDPSLLDPEEAAFVANAAVERVREFAAGRLCARRALAEFGIANFALKVAPDRRPLWPDALVGSITHTAGLCAAVVAERTLLAAIGLDTEVSGAVKRELWPGICVAREIEWLDSVEPARQAAAATLIFSAKEAFYKCQYPLTAERLNFSDLCVTVPDWGAPQGVFAVLPTRPLSLTDRPAPAAHATAPAALRGRFRFHEEFVSAAVHLPARERASQ
jgi:4'-phosphopantetheinyl transferase EntD